MIASLGIMQLHSESRGGIQATGEEIKSSFLPHKFFNSPNCEGLRIIEKLFGLCYNLGAIEIQPKV